MHITCRSFPAQVKSCFGFKYTLETALGSDHVGFSRHLPNEQGVINALKLLKDLFLKGSQKKPKLDSSIVNV